MSDLQKYEVDHEVRRKLTRVRDSKTYSFSVGGTEGYMHVGMYEDGSPGELFLKIAKQGGTLEGLCDALAIVTSLALQYGVPLEAITSKLCGMYFEPHGHTNDEKIPKARSIVDYIFRRIAMDFNVEPEKA